jgi:hypothetical protein
MEFCAPHDDDKLCVFFVLLRIVRGRQHAFDRVCNMDGVRMLNYVAGLMQIVQLLILESLGGDNEGGFAE